MTIPQDNPTANPTPPAPDEWLSAYVDGELTAEEREAVEQRLASDPQARELVESFQSLSSQIGELPSAAAPGELAASVAGRLEDRNVRSGSEAPLAGGAGLRRWGWPALAVAASLVIVVFNRLPGEVEIAKHVSHAEEPSVGIPAAPPTELLSESLAEDRLPAMRAAPEDAVEEAETRLRAPSAAAGRLDDGSLALSANAPMSESSARADYAGGGFGGGGGGFGGAVPALTPVSNPPQAVVRLGLEREAIRNQAFERVLVSNRIAVKTEPPPSNVISQLAAAGLQVEQVSHRSQRSFSGSTNGIADERFGESPASGDEWGRRASRLALSNSGQVVPKTDAALEYVLVDAEALQLEQCLVSFNNDAANFTSVAVEPTNDVRQQLAAVDSLYHLQQREVAPWQNYSRAGPIAQATEQIQAKGVKRKLPKKLEPMNETLSKGLFAFGYAYRFQPSESTSVADGGRVSDDPQPNDGADEQSKPLAADTDASSNRVQVLFVLEGFTQPSSSD